MSTTRFTLSLSIFILVILGLVGGFNYIVNPYIIFADHRTDGLNAYKSDINKFVRQAKAYQPIPLKIETLLVGNSRVEMGLDPTHHCLSKHSYNLGLPGAGVELQAAYASSLIRQKPEIKLIIMSLDFTDFLQSNEKALNTDFAFSGQNRLQYFIDGRENKDYWFSKLKDAYMATLSLDATISSIKTLIGQNQTASTRTTYGFNPARDLEEATRVEGPHQIFTQTLTLLRRKMSGNQVYLSQGKQPNNNFKALQALVNLAETNDIHLVFFVNPLHQSFNTVVKENGLEDDYQRWSDDINTFVNTQQYPHIDFHNFLTMPDITNEPFPKPKQKQPLTWFWEPAHYNAKLGALILDSMLMETCNNN